MNKNRLLQWHKRHLIIHSVFLLLGTILLLVLSFVAYFYLKFTVLYKYDESRIDKKFHAEVSAIPQIRVDRFNLFDGDSMVNITIANKGSVSFWYGTDGVPRITGIEPYAIPFVCFYVDNQGNRTSYAYDSPLVLDKNTKLYKKWFAFEVNNLHDLVSKYDSIIQVLNTFPKDPEMTDFQDKTWGKRLVIKTPNPEFTAKTHSNIFYQLISLVLMGSLTDKSSFGKEIACDLYIRTHPQE